ncbi:MAG: endonuclease/exonuclease/phosphatase family protein [Armatimonadetes bacterium]|nr:endonuclease/exonuclease/phosphatase family protein [Armatimonadota bacterium]
MTFNIRGGLGMDGRRSTPRIAKAVAAHAPDIVCFQEVHQRLPWSGFVDQPRQLRRALGMPFVFQNNLNVGVGGYGLGIASRLPRRTVCRCFLPSVGERRGALEVSLETPDGLISVWCTHWGLQGEERERQAAQMADWIAAARDPVIVCGDCNERADAPAVRRLLAETGLQDAGEEHDLPTYPADTPAARIDFIFHAPALRRARCVVVDSQFSDHRPVMADFR